MYMLLSSPPLSLCFFHKFLALPLSTTTSVYYYVYYLKYLI